MCLNLHAQNVNNNLSDYETLWDEASQCEMDKLPKSGLEVAKKIRQKAQKEGNFVQYVSATIAMKDFESDINPDSTLISLDALEKELSVYKEPVKASVIHAALASGYNEFRGQNFVQRNRTLYNDLTARMCKHAQQILSNPEALMAAKAEDYYPLVKTGDDSDAFGHDLLGAMCFFITKNIKSDYIYEHKIDLQIRHCAELYMQRGMDEAYTYLKLNLFAASKGVKDRTTGSYISPTDSIYNLMLEKKDCKAAISCVHAYYTLTFWHDYNEEKTWFKELNLTPHSTIKLDSDTRKALFLKWVGEKIPQIKQDSTYIARMQKLYFAGVTSQSFKNDIRANHNSVLKFNMANVQSFHYIISKMDGTEVINRTIECPHTPKVDYFRSLSLPFTTEVQDTININVGHYNLIIENAECMKPDTCALYVSNISAINIPGTKKCNRLFLCNSTTGRPLAGASVSFLNSSKHSIYKSDKNGYVLIPREEATGSFKVYTDKDTLFINELANADDLDDEYIEKPSYTCTIWTDRHVYRPGQTVKGKVLLAENRNGMLSVVKGAKFCLDISDSKNDSIIHVTTNDMGTFAFEYKLPEDAELGDWEIEFEPEEDDESERFENIHNSYRFNVAEYKLPTFEVSLTNRDSNRPYVPITIGNTITLTGKATTMDGMPVQNASVSYRFEPSYDINLPSECKTDAEGKFYIPVILDQKYNEEYVNVFATVTDQKGETHECEWVCDVDSSEFRLRRTAFVDICSQQQRNIATSNKGLVIKAFDNSSHLVTIQGKYAICPSSSFNDIILEGTFTSGKGIAETCTLPVGMYGIRVTADGCHGLHNDYWCDEFVIIDSSLPANDIRRLSKKHQTADDKRPDNTDFFYSKSKTFNENQPIEFFFSTKPTDVYFVCSVIDGKGNIVKSYSGVTDGRMKRYTIPMAKGLHRCFVNVFYVKDGKFYSSSRTEYTYDNPDSQLQFAWKSFRNRLSPKQEETWTLSLTNKKHKPVSNAEIMAVLYDTALDHIDGIDNYNPHWRVDSYSRNQHGYFRFDHLNKHETYKVYIHGNLIKEKANALSFDTFNGFLLNNFISEHKRISIKPKAEISVGAQRANTDYSEKEFEGFAMSNGLMGSVASLGTLQEVVVKAREPEDVSFDSPSEVQTVIPNTRTNFSELAFFHPQLRTDSKGEATITFTIPESLTTWRFKSLAHTKDIRTSYHVDTVITRQHFTIRPNMPRFARSGDKVSITSTIYNMTDSLLSGTATMLLTKHDTLSIYEKKDCTFSVEANKSTNVTFTFDAKNEWSNDGGVDCRIIAEAGNASDGELNHLPILSSKQSVTESVPFVLEGEESSISIPIPDSLQTRLSAQDITIDYTDSPFKACIDALKPLAVEVKDKNADALSISAAIFAYAKLNEFSSKLNDKDLYENAVKAQKMMGKLKEYQQPDGSFAWFKGMNGNIFITMNVCQHLLAIQNDKVYGVTAMLNKALAYLDSEEYKNYKERFKFLNSQPSSLNTSPFGGWGASLNYLYLSSQMPERNVGDTIVSMRNAYLDYVSNHIGNLTIYGIANASIALRAFGRTDIADKFAESLIQHTTTSEGQGRNFSTLAAYYSWRDYRIPTHVAAMKAIRLKDASSPCLDEMQTHLLSQKRAQKWDNLLNTIDVVEVLLDANTEQTFHEEAEPTISITNKNVTITKHSPHISWGAVSFTHREDISNISKYATKELSISREVFYRKKGSTDEWAAYSEGTLLQKGDEVRIRTIISADRDMDFVHANVCHPACLEPESQLSGYVWGNGSFAHLMRHDTSTDIRFDKFHRGSASYDLDYRVTREGSYVTGISTVSCEYCNEFGGHTNSESIGVK